MQWFEIKNWLELSTGLDRDSLHIYAGVAVHLAVAVIFRRSLANPIPWLFVVIVALANEYHDYSRIPVTMNASQETNDEAVRDIWNTLLLPSVLLVVARFYPNLLTGMSNRSASAEKLDEVTPSV